MKDATALKLREVALNYSIPEKFLEKTVLTKVTFGFIGRNLVNEIKLENTFVSLLDDVNLKQKLVKLLWRNH